jgi:hypothetical protein
MSAAAILVFPSDSFNYHALPYTRISTDDIVMWQGYYGRVLDWRSDLLDSLSQRMTTLYSSLLHTRVHRHVFTSRCSVAASHGGCCPYSGFPNCPRASATSLQQQLTTTEPQQSSNSLTHSLHSTEWHPGWRPSHTNLLFLCLTTLSRFSLLAAGPCYIA